MKLRVKITKEVLEKSKHCLVKKIVRSETIAVGVTLTTVETQNDEDHYLPFSSNCAVYHAVNELIPDAKVDSAFIGVLDAEGKSFHITLPDSAIAFIQQFDFMDMNQRMLLPEMEFEIDVPDGLIDSIGIDEVKKVLEESTTLELV